MVERVLLIRFYFQMIGNGFHIYNDNNADNGTKTCDHPERCMPAKMICKYKTNGKTQNLAGCKGHLHKAHDPTPHLHFKKAADDGKTYRTDYTPKQTCTNSCHEKQEVIG